MNFDESIVISRKENKALFIEYRKENPLVNFSFYSEDEIIRKLSTIYDDKALLYLHRKGESFKLAKQKLENLTFVEERNYPYPTINELSALKKELLENNLIKYDNLFIKLLKTRKVILYDYIDNKELMLLLNKYDIQYEIVKFKKVHQIDIYKFNDIEEEMRFIFENVVRLLKDGISLNDIKIVVNNDTYLNELKKLKTFYNFYIDTREDDYLLYQDDYRVFREELKLNHFMNAYKNFIEKTKFKEEFYQLLEKFIELKDYILIEEECEYVDYLASIIKLKKNVIDPSLTITRLDKLKEDDYVFIPAFYLNDYPRVVKDVDYLSDEEKSYLNISTSFDKTHYNEMVLINTLRNLKHLYISYAEVVSDMEQTPSLLSKKYQFNQKEYVLKDVIYSKKHHDFLKAKVLDQYVNYNVKTKYYNDAIFNQIPFRKYNNAFTGINLLIDDYGKNLYYDNMLHLSYSSINQYMQCPFKFYMSYAIKADEYEDTIDTLIGKIAHKYIELTFKNEEVSFDSLAEYYAKDPLVKALVLLKKDTVENFIKYFSYYKNPRYQCICEDKGNSVLLLDNVKLEGSIDFTLFDQNAYALFDFKSSSFNKVDLDKIKLGLGFQLPFYYLLSQEKYKEKNFIGMYYINVMGSKYRAKEKIMQYGTLEGKSFDPSFKDFLGEAYAGGRSTCEDLLESIDKGLEEIKNKLKELLINKFDIAPVKFNDNDNACTMCAFKDICYRKSKDYRIIVKEKEE